MLCSELAELHVVHDIDMLRVGGDVRNIECNSLINSVSFCVPIQPQPNFVIVIIVSIIVIIVIHRRRRLALVVDHPSLLAQVTNHINGCVTGAPRWRSCFSAVAE